MNGCIRTSCLGAALAGLAACSSGAGDDSPLDPGDADGVCDASSLVGAFEATLNDGFTSVQGKVVDGVTPFLVPDVVDTAGECRLLRPPSLFCDPACTSGTTCDATGTCVATPTAISVGTVTIDGLDAPVEMTAGPPVFFYTNLDPLDHPGFAPGAEIVLVASGEGEVEAFALGARGTEQLTASATSVSLESDQATVVEWDAPAQVGLGEMHINLNIAQHGGTPGWIECDVADDGGFELPVSLTNQLLDSGFSGFPALSITRRSADRATTAVGCVQLVARSSVVFTVEIPGLISCSDDDDCPDPQTCQGDLTCG